MAQHSAQVIWRRKDHEDYIDQQYSRGHEWQFDGGATVAASSSPHIVPPPYSIEAHVDPEEAFIASLSSCHMLFFLSIAANKQWVVDEYHDHAMGVLERDQNGKTSITKVTLRPKIRFSNNHTPSLDELITMHEASHEQCFIANSVTTEVVTEVILT